MVSPSKEEEEGGMEALNRLKSIDPPLYLSPSPDISQSARSASQYLFSALLPSCPKSPFDRLLLDGFDAEQIWNQIHLQTQPLISNLHREIKRFERNPDEISSLFDRELVLNTDKLKNDGSKGEDGEKELSEKEDGESEGFEEENGGFGEEDGEDEEEEVEEEEGDVGDGGIEDRFLKIKELEEYLENDEAREYGSSKEKRGSLVADEDGEEEEDDDDDEVSCSIIFVKEP